MSHTLFASSCGKLTGIFPAYVAVYPQHSFAS